MEWTRDIPTLCALTSVLLLSTRARSYAIVVAVVGLVWFAMWHQQQTTTTQPPHLCHHHRRVPREAFEGSKQQAQPMVEVDDDADDHEDEDIEMEEQHVAPRQRVMADVIGSPDLQRLDQQRLPARGRNRTRRVVGDPPTCTFRSRTGQTSSFAHLR